MLKNNTNNIEQEIVKMKYMIEHTNSKTLKSYYYTIYEQLVSILNDALGIYEDILIPKEQSYFIKKYEDNILKELSSQFEDPRYKEYIRIMTKRAKKYLREIKNSFNLPPCISLKQGLDIIKEFIDKFDHTLYPIVKEALDEEHLFIVYNPDANGEGYSYLNSVLNSPYIVIFIGNQNKILSIDNLICLVHELGHIIHFYTKFNKITDYRKIIYNTFIEIPSMTFEMYFIDFLKNTNIENKSVEMVLNNNLLHMKEFLTALRLNSFIINEELLCYKLEHEYISELLMQRGTLLSAEEIEMNFDDPLSNYNYSYGGLISCYYLEQYRKDPEKNKKDLYDFMNCIGIMDDYYMLTHFGININRLIECKYLENIVKDNQKSLKPKI